MRVPEAELHRAPEAISDDVAAAIRVAIDNVFREASGNRASPPRREVAGDVRTRVRSIPVAAAGAYAPGGAGAYPSTAVMCCVPAQVAGVERIALASPPGPDGKVNPLVLAAAAMAGATEVYAMGGAQAIAALALGTESVEAGRHGGRPGNRYVQEAKRQLNGRVGIDGIAGPSELMVIADEVSDLDDLALDLCAQAEHGDDGLLVACAADPGVLSGLQ